MRNPSRAKQLKQRIDYLRRQIKRFNSIKANLHKRKTKYLKVTIWFYRKRTVHEELYRTL